MNKTYLTPIGMLISIAYKANPDKCSFSNVSEYYIRKWEKLVYVLLKSVFLYHNQLEC